MASRTPSFLKPTLLVCALQAVLPLLAQAQETEPTTTTQLEAITVTSSADASAEGLTKPYAGGQIARGGRVGILGNQDMMDTPFSSTAYTNELIQNQQAKSVADVLQNDPTVRLARGFGNFQELYMIRGFNVYSDDMSYNGLYGLLPRQYVAAELLERVEVFRGASAFLNGAAPGSSAIGGTVNVLPKRAGNDPLTQLNVGVESDGQYQLGLDFSRRFGADNASGIRVNAVRRDGETAVNNEKRELNLLAVGWDWRSRDIRISADIGYQEHNLKGPRPNVTPNGVIPAAPDASKNFGQSWTRSDSEDTFGTLRAEFDLNPGTTAWIAGGFREGREDNILAGPTVNNLNGDSTYNRADNVREDSVRTLETGARGKFDIGSVKHSWVLSASTLSSQERNAYAWSPSGAPYPNLYNPETIPAPAAVGGFAGGQLNDPHVIGKTNLTSFALADTMSFMDDRMLLTLGARHQEIHSRGYDYNDGSESSNYKKSKVTPMAGLVFKASKELSFYGNYSEGMQKGDIAPLRTGSPARPVSNGGQVTAPYIAKQKELGIKYDAGRFGGSLNLFEIKRPSGYVNASDTFVTDGEQRNRGIELSMFGEVQRGLRLLGGLTLIDAEQVRSNVPANNGNDVIGVPRTMVNLGADWDIPGITGLSLNGRVVYTSSQNANAADTLKIPSWTRVDLGARYLTTIGNRLVTWRARVDNVTDRNYWASVGGYPGSNYLVLGAPRTFVVSASIEF
ncbi:TonB-dependent receptor [Oxalicibacterium flavum]|uniref:TonB-dependent receptor n=1 Tax=Oxalicibacterium flavum TaxID=179467 RepID=A0A8J2XUP0_9BURK|nr:TonB-dependent receptor [Oxalicibacterium flavum]GGB97420.1 TonB-dependent receptor [Oxalicibacterium flavum]